MGCRAVGPVKAKSNRFQYLSDDFPELQPPTAPPAEPYGALRDPPALGNGQTNKISAPRVKDPKCRKRVSHAQFENLMAEAQRQHDLDKVSRTGGLHCFMQEPVRDKAQMARYQALMALKVAARTNNQVQKLVMLVDSGAADHVMPASELPNVDITEGASSKAGVQYTTADGGRLPNLGEQTVKLTVKDGRQVNATFQVADVTRPILSVARLTESGHQVRFHKNGGSIIHRETGHEIPFVNYRGVYVLEARVAESVDQSGEQGFADRTWRR